MSLTEEARAPFSLVDEINQVSHSHPGTLFHRSSSFLFSVKLNPDFFSIGHGPACGAHGAQLDG